MQFTTSKGIIKTYELDIDRILEMEAKDPNYSFMDDLANVDSDKIRFTAFDRMARVLGSDLKQMIKDGVTVEDLMNIFIGCLKEAGFISGEPASASSSVQDA